VMWHVWLWPMTCEWVCVLVDIDEGNNEGVCDDVLDMEKIVTTTSISKKVMSAKPHSRQTTGCSNYWSCSLD
jgi:hypothetical protein